MRLADGFGPCTLERCFWTMRDVPDEVGRYAAGQYLGAMGLAKYCSLGDSRFGRCFSGRRGWAICHYLSSSCRSSMRLVQLRLWGGVAWAVGLLLLRRSFLSSRRAAVQVADETLPAYSCCREALDIWPMVWFRLV